MLLNDISKGYQNNESRSSATSGKRIGEVYIPAAHGSVGVLVDLELGG